MNLETIAKYKKDGCLNIGRVVSLEQCDELIALYEKYATADFAPILNLDRKEPLARAFMLLPEVVAPIESFYGPVDACQSYFFFKRPGTNYAKQEWNTHQDNSYARAVPFSYLAAEIALADQSPDTGSMYYYTGSHQDGLLPFEAYTGYRETPGSRPGNRCVVPKKYIANKVDLVLKKGECLIFDGNLVHATYPNTSDRPRPAIITNYIRKGAHFIAGRTANRIRIPVR